MIVSIVFNNNVSYASNKPKVPSSYAFFVSMEPKDPPTLESKATPTNNTRSTSFFVPLKDAELPPKLKHQPRKSKFKSKDVTKFNLSALHQSPINSPRSSPYPVSLKTAKASSPITSDPNYPLIRLITNNYGTDPNGSRTTQTASRFPTPVRHVDRSNARTDPIRISIASQPLGIDLFKCLFRIFAE